MNPEWFGDSFDIVKRFFVGVLKNQGYQVYVDPMLTGNWNGIENDFFDFLGADRWQGKGKIGKKTALLLDPDTGVGTRKSEKHVTIDDFAELLDGQEILFSFDQSFSRGRDPKAQMKEKLRILRTKGISAFYYDSHAKFLFASRSKEEISSVKMAITREGLPKKRIFDLGST